MDRKREILFFRDYFREFYNGQTTKVQKKILWTLRVIEEVGRIPELYFKHLTGTDGLYEIRLQCGNDIFRIFCFFDDHYVIVIGHGFQKKTEKTPKNEIERAKKIKCAYDEEKEHNQPS